MEGRRLPKGQKMKWIIGSDLHGSAEYTKKFLEAVDAEKADRILLLGDILYHGPRNALPTGYGPMSVFEMLNQYKDRILCVRGNCDAEIDQCVLEFPIMAEYMQIVDSGKLIFATHGDHYNTGHLPPRRSLVQDHRRGDERHRRDTGDERAALRSGGETDAVRFSNEIDHRAQKGDERQRTEVLSA